VDEEQARRIGINESRFRDLNDRLAENVEQFREDLGSENFAVLCECAVTECTEMIPLTFEAYEHVRSNPRWFVVRPDHIIVSAERMVEHHEAYWLIEKFGTGGDVAEALA
jgi:hypothetical protein